MLSACCLHIQVCVVPSTVAQPWHRINDAFLPVAVIKKFLVSGIKNKCFYFSCTPGTRNAK